MGAETRRFGGGNARLEVRAALEQHEQLRPQHQPRNLRSGENPIIGLIFSPFPPHFRPRISRRHTFHSHASCHPHQHNKHNKKETFQARLPALLHREAVVARGQQGRVHVPHALHAAEGHLRVLVRCGRKYTEIIHPDLGYVMGRGVWVGGPQG